MNNRFASLLTTAIICAQALPAVAQQYHKEFGGGRVIMQSQTGLYNPSSTYIGAGTLSRSAQGKASGVGGALPAVNMGSTVRTPGDNMYNNDGSDRMANGSFIYQDQERAIILGNMRKAEMVRRRQMMLDRQQTAAPRGNFYVPGSNTGMATYGTTNTPSVMYRGNGAATYTDSNRQATRGF